MTSRLVAEATLCSMTDHAPDAVFTCDPQGRVLSWNRAAEVLFGMSEAELVGQSLTRVLPEREWGLDGATLRHLLGTGDGEGQGRCFEAVGVRRDESTLPVEVSIWPGVMGGTPVRMGIIRDITERRHGEARLRRARAEAESLIRDLSETSAARSAFLVAVSQELRVPLNTVIGFSDLLLSTPAPMLDVEEAATFIRHIHQAGAQMLRLVNNLLDLARLDARMLQLRPEVFELKDAICSAVAALAPLARERGVRVQPPGGFIGMVQADPTRLSQVVYNMLVTSLDGAAPGDVVRIEMAREDRALELWVTSVRRPEHEKRPQGVEVEVALARELVEAHGGTLRVDVGEDTRCVRVCLPQPLPGVP